MWLKLQRGGRALWGEDSADPRPWVAVGPGPWPGNWREQPCLPHLDWGRGHLKLGGLPVPSGMVPRQSLSPSSATFGKAESGRRKPLLASVMEPRQSHLGPPGPLGAVGSTQACQWKGQPVGPFYEAGHHAVHCPQGLLQN